LTPVGRHKSGSLCRQAVGKIQGAPVTTVIAPVIAVIAGRSSSGPKRRVDCVLAGSVSSVGVQRKRARDKAEAAPRATCPAANRLGGFARRLIKTRVRPGASTPARVRTGAASPWAERRAGPSRLVQIASTLMRFDVGRSPWLPNPGASTLQTHHEGEDHMSQFPDFGTFGRYQETPVDEMPSDMKAAYEGTTRLRGMVPGPHKIWVANPKLSQTIIPTGAYFQTESTLTKAEIEIATNLINGKWHAAYGNYEHEIIGHFIGG